MTALLSVGERRTPIYRPPLPLSSARMQPASVATPATRRALHAIALFEGIKGIAAIAASVGLLGLLHRDMREMAFALIGHYHLDPEARYPRMLLNYADLLENTNLRSLILFAWAYAAIRLAEGYGLWKDRAWAEWLAALSGAVYLPFEAKHLVLHPNLANSLVLLGNMGVVLYMILRLRRRRKDSRQLAEAGSGQPAE